MPVLSFAIIYLKSFKQYNSFTTDDSFTISFIHTTLFLVGNDEH
ncbi:hypothetical protein XNC1_4050 [Xenorhabdus nematophila ATCC 19061]|uniref:Uncharacterized protein n=1 Tax=Xenorhabdus nematophila (strain ATCC 19061 / DSM 3370 / CCUG 14189 / LMG 1036 / NCIMB 9965 / AN6) TaxID=406817 RepID=D3VCP0_XENNA|nr:hypothetical protein XNC1_4050 [Xenorhabdus nematophila ATCC 19061]